MGTSATAECPVRAAATTAAQIPLRGKRRRISPEAGRALELLGHSIEYLADEFIHESGTFSACNPQVEAIQLLMALNREIYLECPEIPSWAERFRVLRRIRSA
jgi:hypothetical protein